MQISVTSTKDGAIFHLSGFLDENVRFESVKVPPLVNLIFDLGEVALINSIGIRSWVNWMKSMRDRSFTFRNCSKAMVDQINILDGFLPPGSFVESFYVPYHCDNCDGSEKVLFRQGREFEKGTADRAERVAPPANVTCVKCGGPMVMDVIESKYFRFLKYRR
ncbi:MAG: hypothetical protein NDI61_00400 [Bdellovibrionaceae bacterium]|nr:hypothetical protein [Pseudobdellovibrionaceae bacterium]